MVQRSDFKSKGGKLSSFDETRTCFLSLARSKLKLCSANHRAGYFCNLACDWLSIVWAYFELTMTKRRRRLWAVQIEFHFGLLSTSISSRLNAHSQTNWAVKDQGKIWTGQPMPMVSEYSAHLMPFLTWFTPGSGEIHISWKWPRIYILAGNGMFWMNPLWSDFVTKGFN